MKIVSARAAADLIDDQAVVASEGFLGIQVAEELIIGIQERFQETGRPRNITLFHVASQGDFSMERGMSRLAEPGLLRRVIGAHWNTMPKLRDMISNNEIEGINFPQGVVCQLFRDIAAHKPGTITHVGLKTFADPRVSGCKSNSLAQASPETYVELLQIDGREYLRYKPLHIDLCLLRGSFADTEGNISFQNEACPLNALSIAQATRNCGGKVIVQVERVVEHGALDPRLVKIPGVYVDYVVVARPENHRQTYGVQFNPAYAGQLRVPTASLLPLPMGARKIIARRAAMELVPDAVVNLGVGIPEGVAMVAAEEGFAQRMHLTVESGPVGGIPAGGFDFGAATNPDCILDQGYQFDFYDGGGLDVAFLGIGECDGTGNINVSKFGPRSPGCGGFIDITQNSKKVVFCGSFTANGTKLAIDEGKLAVLEEGSVHKFVSQVDQITFSGEYAREKGQPVIYITERAVFELRPEGMTLIELAPGVDLKRDVLSQMDFTPILSKDLKTMDERIFRPEKLGLVL